ncbi:hypothetical protein C6P45_001201 [Maudiozyma exigua]|uniref:K Homology domain-containing protein n=1 Tax=Maudiozyma exigua TaxID=34358 RepID=A0A9P6W487_MAUEX|nr:hypothetical protein C6P45_001201 [Kazachstania exigua]
MSETSENNGLLVSGLKRKNENVAEEQHLEAAIKRVALDEEELGKDCTTVVDGEKEEEAHETADIPPIPATIATTTEDNINLRMLCLVRDASLIVGPKGETISKVKSDTDTRINVSENIRGVPERVVYFRGTCENVAKAFGKVARILSGTTLPNSFSSSSSSLTSSASSSSSSSSVTLADEAAAEEDTTKKEQDPETVSEDKDIANTIPITVHLLIPHHLMGYIIGKHGSRLKEIEELSAAKLSASPYQLLPSNDRILKVIGVADALHIATFYIAQTMATFKDNLRNKKTVFYQPGPMYSVLNNNKNNYNSNHHHQQLQHNYYQNSNGSNSNVNGYRNNRRISTRVPMYMMVPPNEINNNDNNNHQLGYVYTPETAANATSFVPNFQIPNVRIVETSTTTSSSSPLYNLQTSQLLQQEIYIDENFVGNIIGREGKHINSIKETTGCSIFIEGPTKGATERKLIIKGTPMGSQAAIMLISNKIELDRNNSQRHNSN